MITVDGRSVLVIRLESADSSDDLEALVKTTMLRESTGRVMFVTSGPADVHIEVDRASLRIDAVGVRDYTDLPADDSVRSVIETTVGMLTRRLNKQLEVVAN
jgi:hypothetical protein